MLPPQPAMSSALARGRPGDHDRPGTAGRCPAPRALRHTCLVKPLDERAAIRRLFDRFGLGARRTAADGGVGRVSPPPLHPLPPPDPPDRGPPAPPPPEIAPPAPVGVDAPRRKDVDAQRGDQQRATK